jgi:hypothetical protein
MKDIVTQEPTGFEASLELGMQELEAMEAPGFWSGFKTGVVISTVASAVIAT